MLVFIDESGDPGFKPGASPIFVAVMVIFDDSQDAADTQRCIDKSDARKAHKSEFKFSKCSDDIRDLFFAAVRNCAFRVRAIVVRKEVIYSPRLKADKDRFYEYFVKNMMDYNGGTLKNARVIIDGSGDREFRQNLNVALRRRLGKGIVKDLRFKSPHSDVLVQLADMCAGAIARSYRPERDEPFRWRKMLAPRINDVWDFKQKIAPPSPTPGDTGHAHHTAAVRSTEATWRTRYRRPNR
jgi:hypothetical protein